MLDPEQFHERDPTESQIAAQTVVMAGGSAIAKSTPRPFASASGARVFPATGGPTARTMKIRTHILAIQRETNMKTLCSKHSYVIPGLKSGCGMANQRSLSCMRCVLTAGLKPLFKAASRWNFFRAWHLYPAILMKIASFIKITPIRNELTWTYESEVPAAVLNQGVAFGWTEGCARNGVTSKKRALEEDWDSDDDGLLLLLAKAEEGEAQRRLEMATGARSAATDSLAAAGSTDPPNAAGIPETRLAATHASMPTGTLRPDPRVIDNIMNVREW